MSDVPNSLRPGMSSPNNSYSSPNRTSAPPPTGPRYSSNASPHGEESHVLPSYTPRPVAAPATDASKTAPPPKNSSRFLELTVVVLLLTLVGLIAANMVFQMRALKALNNMNDDINVGIGNLYSEIRSISLTVDTISDQSRGINNELGDIESEIEQLQNLLRP